MTVWTEWRQRDRDVFLQRLFLGKEEDSCVSCDSEKNKRRQGGHRKGSFFFSKPSLGDTCVSRENVLGTTSQAKRHWFLELSFFSTSFRTCGFTSSSVLLLSFQENKKRRTNILVFLSFRESQERRQRDFVAGNSCQETREVISFYFETKASITSSSLRSKQPKLLAEKKLLSIPILILASNVFSGQRERYGGRNKEDPRDRKACQRQRTSKTRLSPKRAEKLPENMND